MIPQISSTSVPGNLLSPDNETLGTTVAKEMGGVGLNDPSQGLNVQVWTLTTDGTDVTISAPNTSPAVLFSGTNITDIDLAFDQNMRPFVAFIEDGQARFWWFDTQTGMTKFTNLPSDAVTPRCCLDDKRGLQSNSSDILLAYIRGTSLFLRAQRDRYDVERSLAEAVSPALVRMGMGNNLRMHFLLEKVAG